MPNPIDTQIQTIKQTKHIGLMTHVVVGFPTLEFTLPLIKTLAEAGSDLIELQIPFSDPIADGPTIMEACDVGLANGVTIHDCLSLMKQAAQEVDVPLLFTGYYNSVLNYGVEKFCQQAYEAGASGVIIPDIPPDEEQNEQFISSIEKNELYAIRLVSPASSEERLRINAQIAKGFVYTTSRHGVTGAQKELDPELVSYLKRLRTIFSVPIAVGFGISHPDHVKSLTGHADIAVVGSAIIDIIRKTDRSTEKKLTEVRQFIETLR
jgi:tryptophan synthase alpha subunit